VAAQVTMVIIAIFGLALRYDALVMLTKHLMLCSVECPNESGIITATNRQNIIWKWLQHLGSQNELKETSSSS
jgi:hypothetical protein